MKKFSHLKDMQILRVKHQLKRRDNKRSQKDHFIWNSVLIKMVLLRIHHLQKHLSQGEKTWRISLNREKKRKRRIVFRRHSQQE